MYKRFEKIGQIKIKNVNIFNLETLLRLCLNNLDLICTIFLRYKHFIVYIFIQTKVNVWKILVIDFDDVVKLLN